MKGTTSPAAAHAAARAAAHLVGPGDRAPDATVLTTETRPVPLSGLWSGSRTGLALVFLRHFGCPFCREHARELDGRREGFEEAGVDIVMIGPGTPAEAAAFAGKLGLRDSVMTDPERTAYRAYGLAEASARSLLDPRVIAGGVRAAARGFLPRTSSGNPLQLQGQFLIDRDGIIRSATRPRLMSDIPSATALLADARALRADILTRTP